MVAANRRPLAGKVGLVMVLLAVAVQAARGFATPGLGTMIFGGLGATLVAVTWLPAPAKVRKLAVRACLVLGSTYVALILVEMVLSLSPRAQHHVFVLSMQNMPEADPDYGYKLVPNYEGTYFDGVERSQIKLNSLGHRDDEPPNPAQVENDLLLVGDSFTFGMGIERADTIEARIEATSDGKVTAYNTGVPGWGAPQATLEVERVPWKGRAIVYFYFVNDLTFDNVHPEARTVRQGLMVPRMRRDGTTLTNEQIDRNLGPLLDANHSWSPVAWATSVTALQRLGAISYALRDKQLRMTGLPSRAFDPEYRTLFVAQVAKMKSLAEKKKVDLHVVIIPAKGEVLAGEWSPVNQEVLPALEELGVDLQLGLLTRLSAEDYLAHDGHFNGDGSQATAEFVLELVGGSKGE